MSDAGGTGDPTETMAMDWSHSLQAIRQHCMTSLNLESRGEKEKRTIEKHLAPRSGSRVSNKLDTAKDNWRCWLGTRIPDGILLAAYAPEGATKTWICGLTEHPIGSS